MKKRYVFSFVLALIFALLTLLAACDMHVHDWSMQSNETEHWQTCSEDGEEKGGSRQPHEDADGDGLCDVCGYVVSVDGHTHQFETKFNADEHWQQCACGQSTNHAPHRYADGSDKCLDCDYVKPADSGDHTYVTARDATHHWQLCTHCGDIKNKEQHVQQSTYLCTCGYAYDAPASGNLQRRNFWIIGSFTDDRDDGPGWREEHTDEWKFHRLLATDSNGSTQYVFERQFASGDEFKIVNDGGGGYWDGELNASHVAQNSKQLLGGTGSGNITFIGTAGYYRVTVHYGSGNTTVEMERVYGAGVVVKPHEHSYSESWSSDELGHWHASICEHAGLKSDLSSHDYPDGKLVCTVCGYTKQHDCIGGEWIQGKTEHWKNCVLCNERIESTRAPHSGQPCSVCGYELAVSDALTLTFDSTLQGYIVTGYDNSAIEEDVRIPAEYNSKPVVAIGDKAFMNCAKIQTVIIPDSVTKVGYSAFAYCSNLVSAQLGSGVKELGASAFAYTKLGSVTLPSGLQTIGDSAFEYSYLTEVTIPSSVTRIGSFAFRNYMGHATPYPGDSSANDKTEPPTRPQMQKITFEDQAGWKAYPLDYSWDPTVEGTPIDLSDAARNAMYFNETNNPTAGFNGYAQYIWVKG